jgi:hypothetical protein
MSVTGSVSIHRGKGAESGSELHLRDGTILYLFLF